MGGRMWKWDTYGVRKFAPWSVRTVVDVGANVGGFSLMCRVLFPVARIHAVEPNEEAFATLSSLAGPWGVKCHRVALGPDGVEMHSRRARGLPVSGNAKFTEDAGMVRDMPGGYTVRARSLSGLFGWFKVDLSAPYIVKVDVEGGERCILDDAQAEGCFRGALQVVMELHFPGGGTQEQWVEYMGRFSGTHDALLCTWARDEHRRHYTYRPFGARDVAGIKRGQFMLLRKDWGTHRVEGSFDGGECM